MVVGGLIGSEDMRLLLIYSLCNCYMSSYIQQHTTAYISLEHPKEI